MREDVVKFLLQNIKHEVILTKTLVVNEGEQCNRLYVLINGVLQCVHQKHGCNSVKPRPECLVHRLN